MIQFDYAQSPPEIDLTFLGSCLSAADPRPVSEQAAENFGGGWSPSRDMAPKWRLTNDEAGKYVLSYESEEGSEPNLELARAVVREELVVVFEMEWMAIIQRDGTFEVDRAS